MKYGKKNIIQPGRQQMTAHAHCMPDTLSGPYTVNIIVQ
jgi:hypothetical protein